MTVVPVLCTDLGFLDMDDFKTKLNKHSKELAAIMITYPSTFGVFESTVKEVCDLVHQHGGQVYMDGANLNAQMGLTSPGKIGADVGHLNLHKTFSIPHGGGGPGVGAVGAQNHLAPFLPGHSIIPIAGRHAGAVNGAPYGNAGVLPISYAYIRMSGAQGLLDSSRHAILIANYMATVLSKEFKITF
jgi:glycine dehydrogenase